MLPYLGLFLLQLVTTTYSRNNNNFNKNRESPSIPPTLMSSLQDDGRKQNPVKAILFDMDGTLLDTEALSDKALLLAFGESLPTTVFEQSPMDKYRLPWELKKQILGLRGKEWAPIVLEYGKIHWGVGGSSDDGTHLPPPPSTEEFCLAWETSLNDMCEEIEACEGATQLVEELANAGLPMAIATSSRYAGVMKKRIRHEETIFRHMTSIVAGDDPAVKNGKPAPDIYLEAARRLNVDPKDCLVFEDALSGVRSGNAAGCRVVAIPDARFSESETAVFRKEATVVLDTLKSFNGVPFGIKANMPDSAAATVPVAKDEKEIANVF